MESHRQLLQRVYDTPLTEAHVHSGSVCLGDDSMSLRRLLTLHPSHGCQREAGDRERPGTQQCRQPHVVAGGGKVTLISVWEMKRS